MYADEHRGRRSWSLQHFSTAPSSDSPAVVSSGQIAHFDRDRSHAPIFVHVIQVDHMRVWAHRACWLLAVTLFALLPLCACAPGATSSATLRASPTAPPTARTRPTYPPCDRATQWQAPAGDIALDALSMVRADEGWATGEVNPDVPNVPLPTAAVLYHMVNGQWQRLPQTYPGAELTSLSMDSPSDGWAVSPTPMTGSAHPLILHYTSGAWQPADIPALDAFPLPTANSGGISPGSVQMFGPQAGWMFATTNEDPDTSPKSLVLRYEGGVWTVTPGPQVASTVELGPLTAVSADEAWMLGFDPNAKVTTTLIYHYINGAWGNTPRPSRSRPRSRCSLRMMAGPSGPQTPTRPGPSTTMASGGRRSPSLPRGAPRT